MARTGRVGDTIELLTKYYANGVLSSPYDVADVSILDAETGGSLVATVTPTLQSTGIYAASWTIPNIAAGTYYDKWIWQAEASMATQTRTYSFRVDADSNISNIHRQTGPLFVGSQEADFFNSITKELLQRTIRQKLIYYAVSEEATNVHRLYDEAMKKRVHTPVEVNALVLYNEPVQTADQWTIDTVYSIEAYFHIHELEERNLIPREGDFVKWGSMLYEIEKATRPQITYGQIDKQVMVKTNCRVARKSQLEIFDGIEGI